jgi:hypothetical protein
MKTTKTILASIWWLGRGMAMTVGVAVMLALAVGMASTALAGTGMGARFDLGKVNTVHALSSLVGSVAGPSLKIENDSNASGATALELRVDAGKPPMKVNSRAKVNNLNSDRIDGKSARDLARVASFTGASPLPIGTDGKVATTKITAPTQGFLVIDASSNVINVSESDLVACSLQVDNKFATGSARQIELNANQFANRREICSTNSVVPVAAGTHTIDFEAEIINPNTRFFDTALSALYVPFDGSGAPPSSAAISASGNLAMTDIRGGGFDR